MPPNGTTPAKAFYEHKKAAGTKHQATIRALAFQWIRILFRMWKERQPYDNSRDTQALAKSHSPLAHRLHNHSTKIPETTKNVP